MGDPARYRTIDGASFKETADWFARAGRSTSRSDDDPHDGRSRLRRREPVYPRGGDLLPLFGVDDFRPGCRGSIGHGFGCSGLRGAALFP